MKNEVDLEIVQLEMYGREKLQNYLGFLQDLVNTNSFTRNKAGINKNAAIIADRFRPFGFKSESVRSAIPEFGDHLVLTRDGQGTNPAKIALVSHLDTVFSPDEEISQDFHWREDGRRIHGPGTIDIKGGTMMMLILVDMLKKFSPEVFRKVHWRIFINASEEVLSVDFTELCRDRLDDHMLACLVFESGSMDDHRFKLVTARKGRATFTVKCTGKAAHAGNHHHLGTNAIVELARVIQLVHGFTDYERFLTFNVGTVTGGSVVNVVPSHAEAEIEMRTFSEAAFSEGVARMRALNGPGILSSQDGFLAHVETLEGDQNSPWPENPGTEKLFSTWEAAAQKMNMLVQREQRGGLSDGNGLWQICPTLDGLGPAGDHAHCSEHDPASGKFQEYISVPSIIPKAMLNYLAVTHLIETSIPG